MDTTKLNSHIFDIMHELNSLIARGSYRGREISDGIIDPMNTVSEDTLVIVDFTNIRFLSSSFCEPAFGLVFSYLKEFKWRGKYLIFKMHSFQRPLFFQGIMKYLKKDCHRRDAEIKFIEEGMYAKLMTVDNDQLIDFVGKLDDNEETVLGVVNKLKRVTARSVCDETRLHDEDVVYNLDALVKKYFIWKQADKEKRNFYCSFLMYL